MRERFSSGREQSQIGDPTAETIEKRVLVEGFPIFLLLFFLSGMCALIYEIAWTRRLTLIFGNTVYSISTVLVAFMGGLAFGSIYFGRIVDGRKDPIRIYGLLEIGVGVSALLIPLALSSLNLAYRFLYDTVGTSNYLMSLFRFVLCTAILIIPTTLMGATLPVLSKFIVRRMDKTGLEIGLLYATNTLGAVVGCFLAGFVLIAWIGISRSEQLAATINILVSLVALTMHYRMKHLSLEVPDIGETKTDEIGREYGRSTLRLVLFIFGVSGMLALAYEVLWTRILIFLLDSSIYSFSMILMVYLLGLTVGSLIAARVVDKLKKPINALGWVEIFVGLSALAGLLLFNKLPFEQYSITISPAYYLHTNFLSTLLVVLPPTLLLGASFPIVVKIYARKLGSIGKQTGNLYAVNTIGAILGSFISGFVLIPLFGSKNSMIILVLLSIAAGFALLWLSMKQEGAAASNWLAGAFLILPLAAFPFGNDMMRQLSLIKSGAGKSGRVLAFNEDATAAVAALEGRDGLKRLSVNGVSMTVLCAETQLMAHIPIALAESPQKVLNICFGMGSTFVSARKAGMEVDFVELCPFVLETFKFFQKDPSMLDEEGVGKIIADGRNYLLLSDKTYDIINIDPPPPPWSAGTVNLCTKEFYELCKERLTSNGIICQWLPMFGECLLSEEQYKMLLRTFVEVFPHTTVWSSPSLLGTYLIGTPEKLQIEEESFDAYFDDDVIARDLSLYSNISFDGKTVRSLFLLDEDDARDYVADAPIMTDDLPLIEFPLFRNGPQTKIMDIKSLNKKARAEP